MIHDPMHGIFKNPQRKYGYPGISRSIESVKRWLAFKDVILCDELQNEVEGRKV